jgi:Flp pilus assembly protein TadD
MAFNPTRLVLSIPLEHATPDIWSTFHIPECLALRNGVTPEIQDHVIAGILDLLALRSLTAASDHSSEGTAPFQSASIKDQLIYSKALNLKGAHREAREVLRRLVAKAPESAGVWTNLGYTYILLEEWAEAVEASKHAFEMRERTTSSRCLGTSLLGLGQYEDACAGFRRALATHSSYGAAWLGLGNALLALGRHEEAREAFERIENLKPDNPWAYEDEENVIQARKYLENLLY